MTSVKKAVNIDEIGRAARRYLPGFLYDFIEGGVDGEEGLSRNAAAFAKFAFLPRYLVDVAQRSTHADLFGRRYSMPFGIAPAGPAALFRPRADLLLANAARAAGIPFVLSGAGGSTLEEVKAAAPDNAWFQLYTARDRAISHDQIRRAADAGIDVLVVTVDLPVTPKRERYLRNRLSIPLQLSPSTTLRMAREMVAHPAWFVRFFASGGIPPIANWSAYMEKGATGAQTTSFFFDQAFTPGEAGTPTWRDLETYRRLWKGKLVVKGLLHPDDAARAADLGCEGVIVSNHGGKALDRAPASLEALPAVRAAVGDRMAVMLDSGIRRGSDVVIALCLGADFVFAGRPTLYGVAAGGEDGARKALDIIATEIDLVMAMLGCTATRDLNETLLVRNAP